MGKKNKPSKAARLSILRKQQPFDADSLRDLLRDKVLGRLEMPDNAEIERLVGILNFWKNYYADLIVEVPAQNELLEQERKALNTLATVLPKIKTKISRQLDSCLGNEWKNIIIAAKTKRLKEIDALLDYIKASNKSGFWNTFWEQDTRPDKEGKWRELQDALCEDFVNTMKSANPSERFGLSETGVLARFIAAVIPSITGENIEVTTVGRYRKWAAKRKTVAEAEMV